MSSRSFSHLKPLSRYLPGRTLALRLHHLPGKGPLQAKGTPWAVCGDVRGAQFEQEQIGHDGYGHGAFDTAHLLGDLMLAQADDLFQFFKQDLYPPPPQIDGDDMVRRHDLRQIGHEDFRLVRPIVSPTHAEDHRDISQMAQAHRFGIDPEGAAATCHGRQPDLGIPPARQMSDEGFEGFPIAELPGAGESQHIPIA
jgi:hypothetical protein